MKKFHPFQWVVDTTQKRSTWWCRLMLKFYLIGVVLTPLLRSQPWAADHAVWIGFALVSIAAGWRHSQSEATLAGKRTLYGRYVWPLWVTSTFLCSRCVIDLSGETAAFLLHVVSFALFCSFALCDPPAPQKRKTKFVSSPTGA